MNIYDDDKIEVKYETKSAILINRISEIVINVLKPIFFIVSIVFLIYGLFYLAIFFILLFSVIYFYKRIRDFLSN